MNRMIKANLVPFTVNQALNLTHRMLNYAGCAPVPAWGAPSDSQRLLESAVRGGATPFFLASVFLLEGALAAERGDPVTDNPHEWGGVPATRWADGWLRAKQHPA